MLKKHGVIRLDDIGTSHAMFYFKNYLVRGLIMKKIIILLASLFGISSVLADVPAVSPQQAAQMQSEQNAVIIDVRENDEWNAGHIDNAIHIPLNDIQNRLRELAKYQNQPVITQCRSGARSAKAADILAKSGFTNVHNMDGGLNAWQKANLKTIQAN
jgi:rhodanese-related sulfurtransferase